MSKYNCDLCKFKSSNKTDYNRHTRTKKHKEKVEENTNHTLNIPKAYPKHTTITENEYRCAFCNNTYSNSSSLARHKKACGVKEEIIKENAIKVMLKEKDITITENKVTTLEKEVESLQKQLERSEKEKEIYQKEKEAYQRQIEMFADLLKEKTSPVCINNFTYISNTYPNAPPLKSPSSYKSMLEKEGTLVEVVSRYYYDKKLVSFVGDFVIRYNKKDEPEDQSIWSSDISRLSYIIRESCAAKKDIWTFDKKGCQTTKITIEPTLQHIRHHLLEYCQKNGGTTEANITKHMIAAVGTIEMIDSGILAVEIIKYIAPEFSVKQIELPKQNTVNKIEQKTIQSKKNKPKQIKLSKTKPIKQKIEFVDLDESLTDEKYKNLYDIAD